MPEYAVSGKGGRWYRFGNDITPGGLEVPSVTTILSNGLPAPALKSWGEKMVAEYAVDEKSAWEQLDRQAAIDVVKRAPYRSMTSAGNRGTDIHTVAEIVLEDKPLPDGWAELYRPQVEAIRAWLTDYKVRPISWERTVANKTVGYAGTYDLYAEVDGHLTMVDWKSSKGVYGKMGLQLAAYSKAEWELVGTQTVKMPPIHRAGIVHVLKDGGYEWRPVQQDLNDLYHTFSYVAEVAAFVIYGEREVLAPHTPPVDLPAWRADLKARVEIIKTWGQEPLEAMAAAWPAVIPTFKNGHEHSQPELEALDYAIRRVENHWRPPPPVASHEAHDLAISILETLTEKQLEKVTTKAVAAGVPNLKTYRATEDQLELVTQIVGTVRRTRKKPTNQPTEALNT